MCTLLCWMANWRAGYIKKVRKYKLISTNTSVVIHLLPLTYKHKHISTYTNISIHIRVCVLCVLGILVSTYYCCYFPLLIGLLLLTCVTETENHFIPLPSLLRNKKRRHNKTMSSYAVHRSQSMSLTRSFLKYVYMWTEVRTE